MGKRIVVAGIDTDAGKTLVSAILMLGLEAEYWKPIQAGTDPTTDTKQVQEWTGIDAGRFHPETYLLENPMSPNEAARREGVEIDTARLVPPETDVPLIIETAGGLHVPVNDDVLFIDLLRDWKLPVVLVSRTYLGSINHTLMSVETLDAHDVPIAGIVFNDGGRPESENSILNFTGLPVLGRVPQLDQINADSLRKVWEESFEFD